MQCFPTTTLRYHEKLRPCGTVVSTQHGGGQVKDTIYERPEIAQIETLFPDENFMRVCEKMGFNRNNDTVRLMPLLKYVSEQSI
jgi:hypothetical protein